MSTPHKAAISIIIPLWNGWDLTRNCLASIYECAADGIPFEVICVDNASYDDTRKEVSNVDYPKLKIIFLDRNYGFAKACNEGANAAANPYLVFLNNDMVARPGAFAALLEAIGASSSVGIVGSRLLYPNNTIQHAGMAADQDLTWHHVYRHYPAAHPLVMERRSFQAVTGASLIIHKGLFEDVNGFDEEYRNSYEDVDLCFKIRAIGKHVVYEPASVLTHLESMSEGRCRPDDPNRNRFEKKWGDMVRPDLDEMTTTYARTRLKKLQYDEHPQDPNVSLAACLIEQDLKIREHEIRLIEAQNAVRNSLSYKLGNAILALPRLMLATVHAIPSWRWSAPLQKAKAALKNLIRVMRSLLQTAYHYITHKLVGLGLFFYRHTPMMKSLARPILAKHPGLKARLEGLASSNLHEQAGSVMQQQHVADLKGPDRCIDGNCGQAYWEKYPAVDLSAQKVYGQPLLSLCITTYNRAEWLRHSLNNIIPQLDGLWHLVELVICDNASTDTTETVAKEYAENADIRYYRNPKNVGMLGNLGVTANHARGKFVWIIGDDDMLLEGTLEHILKAIIAFPDIEMLYTNYSYTRAADPKVVSYDELIRTQTPIAPITQSRYCRQLKDVAGNTENFFTAIYCCIFRSDHARACFNQDTGGRPFSSLLTCVPTTNYVLDNLLDRPAFWYGDLAVLVNMNVSWLKYVDLWILERFPEMYHRFQEKGVSSTAIDSYRKRSIPGVVHHLKEAVGRKSGNLDIINLACLFRSYGHLSEFQAVLPQVRAIIGQNQCFEQQVDFSALPIEHKIPGLNIEPTKSGRLRRITRVTRTLIMRFIVDAYGFLRHRPGFSALVELIGRFPKLDARLRRIARGSIAHRSGVAEQYLLPDGTTDWTVVPPSVRHVYIDLHEALDRAGNIGRQNTQTGEQGRRTE